MAADLEALAEYLEAPSQHQLIPAPYYERRTDSLLFYTRDERSYGKRMNQLLTLFLSTKDSSLVGCELKGLRRICDRLERLGGKLGVAVLDKKVKLGILMEIALAAPCDDPELEEYEHELGQLDEVEIDREELCFA